MKNIILLAILIAVLAAFFASANPDGLEKIAENLGFIDRGIERTAVMTDYVCPFISQEGIATAAAGIIGVLLTFGVFLLAGKVFRFKV